MKNLCWSEIPYVIVLYKPMSNCLFLQFSATKRINMFLWMVLRV